MKKTLFILISVLSLLCGCKKEEKTLRISLTAVELINQIGKTAALESTREYSPENPNSKDVLKNYYKIENPDEIEDFCILLQSYPNISEVAIFRFNSSEGRKIALDAIEKRYENILQLCKIRNQNKLETVQKGLILEYENAVVLIVTPSHNEIIKSLIENSVA